MLPGYASGTSRSTEKTPGLESSQEVERAEERVGYLGKSEIGQQLWSGADWDGWMEIWGWGFLLSQGWG